MINHNLNNGHTRKEIEEIVKLIRLDLYNKGVYCGAKVIKNKMEKENTEPVPSERTIGRILSRHGLTHGRTGFLLTACILLMILQTGKF